MITHFETHADTAPEGWDDLVCQLGGSIFHSTLWAEYQYHSYSMRPVYLLARDAQGLGCAGGVALFEQSHHPIASLFLRNLRLCAHPCSRHQDRLTILQFMQHCEAWARAHGCARLVVDSFMSGMSPFVPLEHGYTETQRVEFTIDLHRDLDSLWHSIRKDQRERIRRLQREGVYCELETTREALQGLQEARESTQAKRFQKGQGYELPTDGTFYERLYEHLMQRGAARLFVARHAGTVIAALFFATFNGHAYSMFSGSTTLGYKLSAQSGLFWAAVETFKAEGFVALNRGGVPAAAANASDPLHGIYSFKARLGTNPILCRSGYKVLRSLRDRVIRVREGLRALSRAG